MIHVLLTRLHEDSLAVAEELQAMGVKTSIIPLQGVKFFPLITPLDDIQALVFTSKNGVRAFCRSYSQRDMIVYCVGDGTAELSLKSGFKRVHSAKGNVHNLVDLIKKRCNPSGKMLLYISGKDISHDLGSLLPDYPVERIVGYEIKDQFELTETDIQALINPSITHVCLFSNKSGERFGKVIKKYKCEETCKGRICVTFSEEVANQVEHLPWEAIKTLDHPSLDAMFEYIDDINKKD